MHYLILVTIASSALYILLRISEEQGSRKFNALIINYLLSMVLSGAALLGKPVPGGRELLVPMGLGLFTGMLYPLPLINMQVSIHHNGMIATSTFSRLGIIVPILFSVLLFGEVPSTMQTAGIALAVVAIILFQWQKGGSIGGKYAWLLLLQLVISGTSNGMSKVYAYFGQEAFKDYFMFFTFLSASVTCMICRWVRREGRISRKEFLFGLGIGTANFLSSLLTLYALFVLPGYVVYPVVNVGSLVLVAVVSMGIWKDRLTRRQVGAMILIFIALAWMSAS